MKLSLTVFTQTFLRILPRMWHRRFTPSMHWASRRPFPGGQTTEVKVSLGLKHALPSLIQAHHDQKASIGLTKHAQDLRILCTIRTRLRGKVSK